LNILFAPASESAPEAVFQFAVAPPLTRALEKSSVTVPVVAARAGAGSKEKLKTGSARTTGMNLLMRLFISYPPKLIKTPQTAALTGKARFSLYDRKNIGTKTPNFAL
jgi:hypothetical protein